MIEPELTLVLIGFGNVARRFVKLLGETADRLDFSWKIVGISTRRHGSVVDPAGVDTRRAIATVFERLDYRRLASIYCYEGGDVFWRTKREPCRRLGMRQEG